jgi:hypothetical protein
MLPRLAAVCVRNGIGHRSRCPASGHERLRRRLEAFPLGRATLADWLTSADKRSKRYRQMCRCAGILPRRTERVGPADLPITNIGNPRNTGYHGSVISNPTTASCRLVSLPDDGRAVNDYTVTAHAGGTARCSTLMARLNDRLSSPTPAYQPQSCVHHLSVLFSCGVRRAGGPSLPPSWSRAHQDQSAENVLSTGHLGHLTEQQMRVEDPSHCTTLFPAVWARPPSIAVAGLPR